MDSDSLRELMDLIGLAAAYGGVGIIMLVIGGIVIDILIPGNLRQQIWVDRANPIPVVSGLDARLIEAEAKLRASDITGMMTTLNALRRTPPSVGPFTPAAMSDLATPATADAATSLFFREKAFWQFGRGTRLGDLRRLVRQYNRPATQVFPTGRFHKSGGAPYGADVNLPVTDNERTNPNFTGCIDRNA